MREDEILESLRTASQRLEPQEAAAFWQKLGTVGEMDRSALRHFLGDAVPGGKCVIGAALVISCYVPDASDGPPSDGDETQVRLCEREADLVAQAFRDATGKKAITGFQPTRDEFLTLIEEWIEQVKEAIDSDNEFKDFLFYYAGTGCELEDRAFRFIPTGCKLKRLDDYVPLANIIARIEGEGISGCNVIFGIDACRNHPEGIVASAHVVEPPHNTLYEKLFSTPPGEFAVHCLLDVSPFARKMAESIPRMTDSSQIDSILKEAFDGVEIHSIWLTPPFSVPSPFPW